MSCVWSEKRSNASKWSGCQMKASWRRCDVSVSREAAFAHRSARLFSSRGCSSESNQPTNQLGCPPVTHARRGHGSGVATCRRSISMSGMLVNQLHFAGGTLWVWLRRVARWVWRVSIKRRLPLTVRRGHEETQLFLSFCFFFFFYYGSSSFFKPSQTHVLCICKINITSLHTLLFKYFLF